MNNNFNFNSLKNIKIEKDGKILILTMNRPESMNALDNSTLEELNNIFKYAKEDNSILGIIITGNGKAFVAGADISQMKDYGSEEGRNYAEFAQNVFNNIETIEKPVLAAVNGYALGGGCELSMSCDIRIASVNAVFGQPEVNLGVIPCFGGTQRLSRLIGVARAKELIFTARLIKADEALNYGLVTSIVQDNLLLDKAKKIMNIILTKAPMAIKYNKVAINTGINLDLNNALELEKNLAALSFGTNDKTEGMHAFLEKRTANFKNE